MSYRFSDKSLPKKTVAFGSADTLKLVLTANEGGEAKRPHQAFLVFQEPETGLEAPFVMTTKENGKATVDLVCVTVAASGLHTLPLMALANMRPRNTPIFPSSSSSLRSLSRLL